MKERGIIFTAESVRAILAGNKSQTRRVVKNPPQHWTERKHIDGTTKPTGYIRVHPSQHGTFIWNIEPGNLDPPKPSPYGVPGDRLYVKETFSHIRGNGIRTWYRADGEPKDSEGNALRTRAGEKRWMSPLFMPRHESRITLEITGVRVERVSEISEEDAKAEGVEPLTSIGADQPILGESRGRTQGSHPYTLAYAVAWDTLNADRGFPWVNQPWVWVLSFQRVQA